MNIFKKETLQGFSISVLAFTMVACGGSGSDDDKKSVAPASLTTISDVAKAAAGIQAAKTIFNVVISNSRATIEEAITKGNADKDVKCGTSLSGNNFKVTTNTGTEYAKDGTISSSMCLEDGEKFDGTLVYKCEDANCDNALLTATNLIWGNTEQAIDLKTNGTWTAATKFDPLTKYDTFRGFSTISKNAASTTFTSYDRLEQYYFSANQTTVYVVGGGLSVSGASATNCVDGAYAYNIVNFLTMANGTQRLNGGKIRISSGGDSSGPESGTVTFNADGSVKVRLPSGVEGTVSKAEFESYCGLKEAYDFSEKL